MQCRIHLLGYVSRDWDSLLTFGMLKNTYIRTWRQVNLVFNRLCGEATNLAVAWSGRKSGRFSNGPLCAGSRHRSDTQVSVCLLKVDWQRITDTIESDYLH